MPFFSVNYATITLTVLPEICSVVTCDLSCFSINLELYGTLSFLNYGQALDRWMDRYNL